MSATATSTATTTTTYGREHIFELSPTLDAAMPGMPLLTVVTVFFFLLPSLPIFSLSVSPPANNGSSSIVQLQGQTQPSLSNCFLFSSLFTACPLVALFLFLLLLLLLRPTAAASFAALANLGHYRFSFVYLTSTHICLLLFCSVAAFPFSRCF